MDVMGDSSPSEANAEDNGVDLKPLHDQEEQTNHVDVALGGSRSVTLTFVSKAFPLRGESQDAIAIK